MSGACASCGRPICSHTDAQWRGERAEAHNRALYEALVGSQADVRAPFAVADTVAHQRISAMVRSHPGVPQERGDGV